MRVLKQVLIGLVIVLAALGLWAKFMPGGGAMLTKLGVPQSLVSRIAPSKVETPETAVRRGGAGGAPLVVTEPVDEAVVNDRLNAIGNGEAKLSVTVTPLSTGNLTEVLVKSGDRVNQGQVIARLDSDDQTLAVSQAQVALASAEEKLERNRKLGNAVSIATTREAEFARQTAELDLEKARLDLKRRDIVAPSQGIVGIITVNPGDYVTTETAIAVIDDRSQILVDFWVPERFSNAITVGQTVSAKAISQPTRPLSGVVDAIDNRVDQTSRTLRIRARLDNPDDSLRAGMSFSVEMRFPGDVFPTVNPLAVQWSADGSFVWRVADDKSHRVPVRIIQRNSDKVLVDAKLSKGDAVIMEGLQRLRDDGGVKRLENADAQKRRAAAGDGNKADGNKAATTEASQ